MRKLLFLINRAPPTADPDQRTWMWIVDLGSNSGKHKWGCREKESGKGRNPIKS